MNWSVRLSLYHSRGPHQRPIQTYPFEDPMAKKGHWRKGKSRNLDPAQMGQARTLVEVLRRALDAGYKHPTVGVLSRSKVAARLKVSAKALNNWLALVDWPPDWALDELRIL